MSGASEQANGRASGPVLQSVFLVDLAHSGGGVRGKAGGKEWLGKELQERRKEEELILM